MEKDKEAKEVITKKELKKLDEVLENWKRNWDKRNYRVDIRRDDREPITQGQVERDKLLEGEENNSIF